MDRAWVYMCSGPLLRIVWIMRRVFRVRLFLFFLLCSCVGIAAFVLLHRFSGLVDISRIKSPTSPRIACASFEGRNICTKFEVPITRCMPTSSAFKRFCNAIVGSGPLVSEEDRQIRRIMDVEGPATVSKPNASWLIPDVQVVLWFVILCCLMEGIVSGYKWWRTPRTPAYQRSNSDKKCDRRSLQTVDEEDEDDEMNIPVL